MALVTYTCLYVIYAATMSTIGHTAQRNMGHRKMLIKSNGHPNSIGLIRRTDYVIKNTVSVSQTGPIRYDFNNLQCLLIIFGKHRPYSIFS